MREEALRMECVKGYSGEHGLYAGNLSVLKGEIVGVIGLRNSGITEMFRILTGKSPYRSGGIYLDERRIHPWALAQPEILGIADIHYSSRLNDELTVAENIILMNHKKHGMKILRKKSINEQAAQLLNCLGIMIPVQVKAAELTVAEHHLILIARSIYEGSRIIILENIHQQYSQGEMDILGWMIRRIARKGISFICKYYNDSYMLRYMNKLTFLRNGATVGEFEQSYFADIGNVRDMLGQMDKAVKSNERPMERKEVLRVEKFCTVNSIIPVSFSVMEGETVVLLDEEGSQGREITDILSGKDIRSYISGKAYVDQKWVHIMITRDIMQSRVVFFPEDASRTGLYRDMTIGDNILLTRLAVMPGRFWCFHRRIPQYMAKDFLSGLSGESSLKYDIRTKAGELSEKERYELLFYKSMKTNPRLFIMQNPLAYNDEATRAMICQKIQELNEKGIAVLINVRDISSVPGIPCRILKLHP